MTRRGLFALAAAALMPKPKIQMKPRSLGMTTQTFTTPWYTMDAVVGDLKFFSNEPSIWVFNGAKWVPIHPGKWVDISCTERWEPIRLMTLTVSTANNMTVTVGKA